MYLVMVLEWTEYKNTHMYIYGNNTCSYRLDFLEQKLATMEFWIKAKMELIVEGLIRFAVMKYYVYIYILKYI